MITGGAAAAPGIPWLVWLLPGRHGVWPLLAIMAGVMLATAMLNATAAMYQARQVTQRKQIERHSADVLADALARCINDTHTAAPGHSVPGGSRAEAARIRADASQTLSSMLPAVLALVHGQQGDPTERAGG
jgi:hypothetical protein